MGSPDANNQPTFLLTDEHRMLLEMRRTLYEGSWEDFEADLRARLAGRPHVFETVTYTPSMKETIERHLHLIEAMRRWEETHDRAL